MTDTITIRDTISIPEVHTDTLFKSSVGDTVYIEMARLKIKYVRLPGDSVYISGKCDTVFIPIEKKITVEKVVIQEPGFWEKWHWWYWLVIAGLVLFLVFRK